MLSATTACSGKETRKVVAIVDTGLPTSSKIKPFLCKNMQTDVTGYGIKDVAGHGTNIAGIIAKTLNPKTHCIAMIKWWHSYYQMHEYLTKHTAEQLIESYMDAVVALKPSIVNMSLSGGGYSKAERDAILALLKGGSTVVVAAGNDSLDLSKYCVSYPACYFIKNTRFHVVGGRDVSRSNYNSPVTDYRPGRDQCGIFSSSCLTGTSQSTAVLTSELINER